MKVITLNVNGIRAAAKKGFFEWLDKQDPDFVCLQETKSQEDVRNHSIFMPEKYHCAYSDAEKKGYSGVALFAKEKPLHIRKGWGWDVSDREGRYLQFDYEDFSVVSLYVPSGSSGEERQRVKFEFLEKFQTYLAHLEPGRSYIFCGDWNIAHTNRDLKNWRGNQKNSGFLPEERAWLDNLFGPLGFVDLFRTVNQEEAQYTWWSNRGQAWALNVGWRIDYQVATPGFKARVVHASIYKEERFSDHAPLILEYA